jgi:hypothetical protein
MSTQNNQMPTQTPEEKRDEDALLAVISALSQVTEGKSELFVFPLRRIGKLGLRALLDSYDKINPDLNQTMKTTDVVSVLQNIRDKATEDGWVDDDNASVLTDSRCAHAFPSPPDARVFCLTVCDRISACDRGVAWQGGPRVQEDRRRVPLRVRRGDGGARAQRHLSHFARG